MGVGGAAILADIDAAGNLTFGTGEWLTLASSLLFGVQILALDWCGKRGPPATSRPASWPRPASRLDRDFGAGSGRRRHRPLVALVGRNADVSPTHNDSGPTAWVARLAGLGRPGLSYVFLLRPGLSLDERLSTANVGESGSADLPARTDLRRPVFGAAGLRCIDIAADSWRRVILAGNLLVEWRGAERE